MGKGIGEYGASDLLQSGGRCRRKRTGAARQHLFPIACYAEDLAVDSVSWHWHEDYEFVLATRGVVYVDINKTRLRLTEGEGVFINSGALHTVEPARDGPSFTIPGCSTPGWWGGWIRCSGRS